MKTPLATVIMPTYNGEKFVVPAIESIINQTYANFELLIVDDASTDNTVAIIENIISNQHKAKIRLLRHSANQGVSGATNTALENAEGKYILPMDHDDIALPHRLETCISFLEKRPELTGCGAQHIKLKKCQILNLMAIKKQESSSDLVAPEIVAASSIFGGMLFNPTVCFKREALEFVSEYFPTNLKVGADNDFYARLQQNGARFAILPNVVTLYRRHGQNTSLLNKELANITRQEIATKAVLKLLPDASTEELSLHARLVIRDKSIAPIDLMPLKSWFTRLINASTDSYLKEGLKKILATNWNRACVLAACKNFSSGWNNYQTFADINAYLPSKANFLYQYQKRKLNRIFKGK